MAPHSSTLAWKILRTEEPGRLQSMGSLRVGHDWATALSLLTFTHWRRKWQPTPVFLPGESQGREAWWAAVSGVAQSWTRLKCLSSSSSSSSRQCIKKQRHHFANKDPSSQIMVFPVVMCGCESWTIKKAECQRIDVFKVWFWRRLLRVPWIAKRLNQSILKEVNSIFTGRTGAEAEAPILWPPDGKNRLLGKDPEDEIVEWHHWLNGHEFEQIQGVGDGQGSLVCCSSWGGTESDST